MRALLICPGERKNVIALTEFMPLANLPLAGKSLVAYWLEHLASRGAREILILASDRPEQVRALVGGGERWGLRVSVFPERRELTPGEALRKFGAGSAAAWLPAPDNARVMDCLPGLPECPLFASYADWYIALMRWLPRAATPDRIGIREIKPGVRVGLRTRLAADVELRAPCWLGNDVQVGRGAIIGPEAVVEDNAVVEAGAEISHSVIGPGTFAGQFTEIRDSLAWGSLLAGWRLNSCIRVQDSFLLSSLGRQDAAFTPPGLLSRALALLAMGLTLPLALAVMMKSKLRGRVAWQPRIAVRPRPAAAAPLPDQRLIYYELADGPGWLRRWPQLWKIARGNFSWIGNRPLNPEQAASLANEFERRWLASPIGLISLGDVEGCGDVRRDEARAHASFYAARAGRRLNIAIFARALFLFLCGIPYIQARGQFAGLLARAGIEAGHAR